MTALSHPRRVHRGPLLALFSLVFLAGLTALAESPLDPNLTPLEPFVGRTWKGEVRMGEAGPVKTDVQSWSVALGGKAVRIRHAFTDGSYGGETLVMWDAGKQAFVYVYFTTAGFYTEGTMAFDGRTFTSREEVHGSPGGVSAVEMTGVLLPDGTLKSSARYLKGGKWVEGRESIYTEAPGEQVNLD